MKARTLREFLETIPGDAEVFMGDYECVGPNGKETWALYDPYIYFRKSCNSCKSCLPSAFSVVENTLIFARESDSPLIEDYLEIE
jgi:hypothetical protein